MQSAKIFKIRRRQAVRLPEDFYQAKHHKMATIRSNFELTGCLPFLFEYFLINLHIQHFEINFF